MSKNKGGRPSSYRLEYNEQARKLCLMGYTDKELAGFFNVAVSTINKWKIDKDGFSDSLKAGKVIADAEVTASLYHRAVGYSHKETKVFAHAGDIITHDVEKIYPPDPISIKYWLNNRQKDRWREKVETGDENETGDKLNISFSVSEPVKDIRVTSGT